MTGDKLDKTGEENLNMASLRALIEKNANFAFEVQTLRQLSAVGFSCQHAGTYVDRVTGKLRQFDIRAEHQSEVVRHSLAVECKNIPKHLLVHRTKRKETEGRHDLILAHRSNRVEPSQEQFVSFGAWRSRSIFTSTLRISSIRTPYRGGEYVGRALDKVHYGTGKAQLASDSEVFEKMSQAISSAMEVAEVTNIEADIGTINSINPILVVPNDSLLAIDYDETGNIEEGPGPVNHCQFFVGKEVELKAPLVLGKDIKFNISHLDIVTSKGLDNLLHDYFFDGRSHGRNMIVPRR